MTDEQNPEQAARRKRANIRLAAALAVLALVIYLGFILLHV